MKLLARLKAHLLSPSQQVELSVKFANIKL